MRRLILSLLLILPCVGAVTVESRVFDSGGKRWLMITATRTDDTTGKVLSVNVGVKEWGDPTPPPASIPSPKFEAAPALRDVSGLTPILRDIDSRMPSGHPFRANDYWTWAHETTHGINNRLRNASMQQHGGKINTFYLPGGKAIYCNEPQTTISQVAPLVPQSLRGLRYNLYLNHQQGDWNDRPLYLLDEWVSYINGARVFLECTPQQRANWIVTPGAVEFAIYGTCVAWAANSDDKQLKQTIAYFWREALWLYGQNPRPESYQVFTNLQQSPDCQRLREFCVSYFGKEWTQQNILKPVPAPGVVPLGGEHWLPPRHAPSYYDPKPKEQLVRVNVQPQQIRGGYPVRGSWWTGCGSWQHMTVGEHAGKFDHNWLRSLSWAELQSLHSDDHEGRVKWAYVRRPGAGYGSIQRQPVQRMAAIVGPQARFQPAQQQFCPT